MRRNIPVPSSCVWVFAGLFLFLSAGRTAQADERSALAEVVPSGAIVYGEFSGLGPVIDRIREADLLGELEKNPQVKQFQQSPEYRKVDAGRRILELQLGMDLWTAAKTLLGGRAALALYPRPDSERPDALLVIRSDDREALVQLRNRIEPLLILAGDRLERTVTKDGAMILRFGDRLFVSLRSEWVVVAARRELLTGTLDLIAGNSTASLAADAPFALMARQMGSEHLFRLFFNAQLAAQADRPRLGIPEKLDNPVGSLLLGGLSEVSARSPYAGLTLDVHDRHFVLTAGVSGDSRSMSAAHRAFFSDPSTAGTADLPQPKSLIAGFTLYRDFSRWYRSREQLLQDGLLPEFDKFESGLANLLPGRDFATDILPLIGNRLTFLAAPQDYDHLEGVPGVKLPGFALIVDLARPDEGAAVIQLLFQTLSAILNIEAGNQGRQPWVLDALVHQDVTITYGKYLQKPSGERLPMVFNFMPASARVGDRFILSSSLSLCRQLVEQLQAPPAEVERGNRNLNFEVYPEPLSELLQANRELIQARALQEGKTLEQAEFEFDLLVRMLAAWKSFRLSTSVRSDAFQVEFQGEWK
jgi:hypothetical protein